MAKEEETGIEIQENPEVPEWVAGLGTFSSLAIYNGLIKWLTSFFDLPPWAIVLRDVGLAGSNVLLGELVGRRMMPGADRAVRIGYIASSLQTITTGVWEAYIKKQNKLWDGGIPLAKNVEEAKRYYAAALEEQNKMAEQVALAKQQLEQLAAKAGASAGAEAAPQQQIKAVNGGATNQAAPAPGMAGAAPALTPRLSRATRQHLRKQTMAGFGG